MWLSTTGCHGDNKRNRHYEAVKCDYAQATKGADTDMKVAAEIGKLQQMLHLGFPRDITYYMQQAPQKINNELLNHQIAW